MRTQFQPCSRRTATHRALLLASLLAACRVDRSVTASREGAHELRRALYAATPAGTPIDSAEAFMTQNGFGCQHRRDHALTGFARPGKANYLYCGKSTTGPGLVPIRWHSAHLHAAGKVTEILVRRELGG